MCISDKNRKGDSFATDHESFVSDYCAAQGLYTLREVYNKSWPDEIPYPGLPDSVMSFAYTDEVFVTPSPGL